MTDQYIIQDNMEGDIRETGTGGLIPSVSRETRRFAVDLIRGDEPTTVLGLLVARGEPVPVEGIAGWLGISVSEVEWTVEMLEEEELCARVTQNGLAKVMAFAAFSEHNE